MLREILVGSGPGQHAVYFGLHPPQLVWLPSDLPGNLPGIRPWPEETDLPNVTGPLTLDVNDGD